MNNLVKNFRAINEEANNLPLDAPDEVYNKLAAKSNAALMNLTSYYRAHVNTDLIPKGYRLSVNDKGECCISPNICTPDSKKLVVSTDPAIINWSL